MRLMSYYEQLIAKESMIILALPLLNNLCLRLKEQYKHGMHKDKHIRSRK